MQLASLVSQQCSPPFRPTNAEDGSGWRGVYLTQVTKLEIWSYFPKVFWKAQQFQIKGRKYRKHHENIRTIRANPSSILSVNQLRAARTSRFNSNGHGCTRSTHTHIPQSKLVGTIRLQSFGIAKTSIQELQYMSFNNSFNHSNHNRSSGHSFSSGSTSLVMGNIRGHTS